MECFGSGSGSRRAKMAYKNRKISCFEVLDVFFEGFSPVAWMSFKEA
jgi:hypothetical protein